MSEIPEIAVVDTSQPAAVVKREVEIYADLDPATWVMEAANLDLFDDETAQQWVTRQKDSGETAYDTARDLDLFTECTIRLAVVEHYADGTSRTVSTADWSDT